MIIILNKRIHTKTKQIPSIYFNEVKDKKIFDLVKIETEKTSKRILEDRQFKVRDKVCCSPWIEEDEVRKNLYHFVPKW